MSAEFQMQDIAEKSQVEETILPEPPTKWISNFWFRILALWIDSAIVGIIGFVIGLLFRSHLISLDIIYGRVLGFSISLLYFSILNSKINHGQTLGKKVLRIAVVDKNNEPISLLRSVIRYSIVGLPIFLNQLPLGDMSNLFINVLLSLIVFGGLIAKWYLYLFNWNTRQVLHDLIVGTYVVHSTVPQSLTKSVWKGHYPILTLLFWLIIGQGIWVSSRSNTNNEPTGLWAVHRSIVEEAVVSSAEVGIKKMTFNRFNGESKTTQYGSLVIRLRRNEIDNEALAKRYATILYKNAPENVDMDEIRVILHTGFDIGIAKGRYRRTYRFPISDFIDS